MQGSKVHPRHCSCQILSILTLFLVLSFFSPPCVRIYLPLTKSKLKSSWLLLLSSISKTRAPPLGWFSLVGDDDTLGSGVAVAARIKSSYMINLSIVNIPNR
ncbi:hypothetical protein S83_063199 [Arachis hypogaea]